MSHSGITELSTTYQKKTQKEHIKDAPDTYIGAVEPDQVKNWSFEGKRQDGLLLGKLNPKYQSK